MWKNLKIYLSNLGFLGYLGLVVFAQEGLSNLQVTSHIIRVSQGLRETETFNYGISEEMEIENRGVTTYQNDLAFWVGEGEDLRVVAFEEDGNDVNLEVSTNEGIATARLEERVFIKPGQRLKVNLDYKVFFTDEKKEEEFRKKILYPHAKESLQFKVNPVENIGFKPQLLGYSFERSKEEAGWFVSLKLSPKIGEVFILRITKEEAGLPEEKREKPSFEEKEKLPLQEEKEREPIVVTREIGKIPKRLGALHGQVKRWIWENILWVIVLNNFFVLSLIGYKCGWFKKPPFKILRFSRLRLPKRRKSGKRKRYYPRKSAERPFDKLRASML